MKKKYLIIKLIAFIFCIISINSYITNYNNSNIKNYLNTGTIIDEYAKDFMPNLDDLPEYKNISYKYTDNSWYIRESYSVVLVVEYDDRTYESEKNKLSEKYLFLQKNTDRMIPEPEFSINSYNFKVVGENGKGNTMFGRTFGMIGTSEKKKSIAYLYFCDLDIDVSYPLTTLVKEHFKYDF
ncbi:hypothetical protein [Tepidibacter hydrothermalis]|uniref:Lipoprotein n=1 Tax=Tepidibacter hydrothermalis TaxID=3036126 RepID=A0ABY8E708_9FIRM|nr:hypothetical protein [Tepidibacter hydrothermalis]WFD08678.1 hypothetical protein P4S50_09715 [Tepidibacter hydrothermalis]